MGRSTFVTSLMNMGSIDEVRLMVNPIILGGGKALFKDVKGATFPETITNQAIKIWQG